MYYNFQMVNVVLLSETKSVNNNSTLNLTLNYCATKIIETFSQLENFQKFYESYNLDQ